MHFLGPPVVTVIGQKAKSERRFWAWWHLEPAGFPSSEEEKFSSWLHITQRAFPVMLHPAMQSRYWELCSAACEIPVLRSGLLDGCWHQKPTLSLTTFLLPLRDTGAMPRDQSTPQLLLFPPRCPCLKWWPRETTRKRASSEPRRLAFGMLLRVF